ncbi:cytosine permease [Flammeovirga sp. EKP202]|uniref:purine-cytosine permease family protein n=1 Tax=Flammeovirga sp. EKP202 TaxID=2770592 RepID=UPI00165F2F41|nr:cytosine permease [Flammeovirga sp. EKP202]MBD0400349.1 cytosine permease [Flammeovirga sp. EKP202]
MSDQNQYTTSKVEAKDFMSGWAIALIIAGTGVSLPILYLGSEITLEAGFENALYAFGVSTLVLTVLSFCTTLIGNRSRLSTYMILSFPFGIKGVKLINLMIGICLLGWYAVALELLAEAINDTTLSLFEFQTPFWLVIFGSSIIITLSTMYGIKSLERLANYFVPFLLLFLICVMFYSFDENMTWNKILYFTPNLPTLSTFEATSILIGSSILLPVLMADFSRFVHNDKHSLISVLGVTLGFPLVLLISAILAITTGEKDIMKMMQMMGLILPAFVLLFITTWVTNATNLYSVVLTFSTISEKFSFKKLCIVTSLLGTLLALGRFSDHLFDFLSLLGVFTPSVSAIYIIDFFLLKKQNYQLEDRSQWGILALTAWLVSSVISLLSYYEIITITSIYFFDSLIIAGLIYFFGSKYINHNQERI